MDSANIATELELLAFKDSTNRKLDGKLRGVLMEIATTGVLRYSWNLVLPVLIVQLESVLRDYADEEQVEIGPSRPLPQNESLDECISRYSKALHVFQDAPFTIQRIAELVLEPKKHYSRLQKIAGAFEKLIFVTTSVPKMTSPPEPPPLITALPPVNSNPLPVHPDRIRASEIFEGYVEQRSFSSNGLINGGTTNTVTPSSSSASRNEEMNVDLTSSLFSSVSNKDSGEADDEMDMT
eukprot:g5200.t1